MARTPRPRVARTLAEPQRHSTATSSIRTVRLCSIRKACRLSKHSHLRSNTKGRLRAPFLFLRRGHGLEDDVQGVVEALVKRGGVAVDLLEGADVFGGDDQVDAV